MTSPPQFTRNADGFFLEVQHSQNSISFLLVSNNEDLFYQLKLTNANLPQTLRHLLPTIRHLYLYLLKNYQHPRAFRIDPQAQIHISVPVPNDLPLEVVFPTYKIIKDSIQPYDQLLFGVQDGVQQLKEKPAQVLEYFQKKPNKSSEKLCLDLQNTDETPRNSEVIDSSPIMKKFQKEMSEKNRAICRQVQRLLGQGCQMRVIRSKLKLKDKTALKMYQQYNRFKRIFSPQQSQILRQNELARKIIRNILQVNHNMNVQGLQQQLLRKGIRRQISFLNRFLSKTQIVYYSDQSSPDSSK